MRIRCGAVGLLALLVLTACGQSEDQKKNSQDLKLKILGEKYIKLKLKDPDSAQFRGQFIGKAGAPCGEVNAKNSFGAYGGFKRYIVAGKEVAVMEADMPAGQFDTSWMQFCR